MEAGDGAAGDGDEAEREDLAGEDRARAVDEAREGGQLQLRLHEQDADAQQQDDAQLHERAQVIARREQQPHRQGAGEEAVDDDADAPAPSPHRVNSGARPAIALRRWPPKMLAITSTKPMTEHSSTLPGRQ